MGNVGERALMMERNRPDIEQLEQIGLERFNELNKILASAEPGAFLKEFDKLSWIKLEENIDFPLELSRSGAFGTVFLEFAFIIRQMIQDRGFGLLGYVNKLILNFDLLTDARYFPERREIRINFGFSVLFNEFENTYAWLSSIILSGKKDISIDDLKALRVPSAVKEEVQRVHEGFNAGSLAISSRKGLASPICYNIVRFILSHEIGHLVYFSASTRLQEHWRQTVWSDYEDALVLYAKTYNINRVALTKLSRKMLEEDVATNWCLELIADGLAFYTVERVAQNERDPRVAQQVSRIAVEFFYHALAIAGDMGSRTHPPPPSYARRLLWPKSAGSMIWSGRIFGRRSGGQAQ